MKFRKLRIAWSVAWGVISMLLITLAVRSNWYVDRVLLPSTPAPYLIESFKGRILLTKFGPSTSAKWRYFSDRSEADFGDAVSWSYVANFEPLSNGLVVPYWPVPIVATILILVPWLSWRFSLRTLLLATTLVAVALGLVVWLR